MTATRAICILSMKRISEGGHVVDHLDRIQVDPLVCPNLYPYLLKGSRQIMASSSRRVCDSQPKKKF